MTQKLLVEFKQQITKVELLPFADGRFEIYVCGEKVFSKLETNRFPEYKEIREFLAPNDTR